ncbi:hypothetical protein HED60_18605 [Planctomycetales bacterium ZRK34]|nr:hypothetical protein HED60_18605 [Planctomycetales bacterium ZRK34]
MMQKVTCLTLLAIAATFAGCATTPKHYDDPITVMMDTTQSHRTRWAVTRQAEAELYRDPKRITALQKMVWVQGYPAEYSNYAVDQLIAIDEVEAKKFLASAIIICRDWDTINYIIDTAVERQWVDFVPALVRNYSLKTPVYADADRPERKAIEKLKPGVPVEQVIMQVFAEGTDASITQRAAAWDLMNRLTDDPNKLIAALNAIEAKDPLVVDLQAGARELHIVPKTMQTVAWLQMLRTPLYGSFWQSARRVVAKLDDEQRDHLDLRHLPMLVYIERSEPSLLSASRAELRDRVYRFTQSQAHHLKGPTYDGPMDEHPQSFRESESELCWADLLTLTAVSMWMNDRAMVEHWFAGADADVKDTTTEYGGLVLMDKTHKAYPQLYKPMMRRHDLVYYAPKQLVLDAYTSLAHFHYHAQKYKNRQYAGPGLGDMKRTARTQRFSALVLTFISEDELNVDYYQPEDVVIDMGTIRR